MHSRSPTPENDTDLLAQMLADEANQSALYKPGPYWAPYQRRVIAAIHRHGIAQFRRRADICKGFADPGIIWPSDLWWGWKGAMKRAISDMPLVRPIVQEYRAMEENTETSLRAMQAAWFERVLPDLDLPDTTGAGAGDLVRLGDRDYSRQYLLSALRSVNVTRAVRFDKMRAVMEIGGGFGFWPHLMLHRYPALRKVVYLDIPPMIYLATQYLKMFHPVRDYRETRLLPEIRFRDDDSVEIICLCPWQIEKFRSPIDLLWNIASFSEMPPAIVRNYGKHIAPLQPRAIYVMLNKDSEDRGTSTKEGVLSALGGDFSLFVPPVSHPKDTPSYVAIHDGSVAVAKAGLQV